MCRALNKCLMSSLCEGIRLPLIGQETGSKRGRGLTKTTRSRTQGHPIATSTRRHIGSQPGPALLSSAPLLALPPSDSHSGRLGPCLASFQESEPRHTTGELGIELVL